MLNTTKTKLLFKHIGLNFFTVYKKFANLFDVRFVVFICSLLTVTDASNRVFYTCS